MIKKKLKYAFLTFIAIAGFGVASGIYYLQSESFANAVKQMISERSHQNLGMVGDFSNLQLYFFPPGIGLISPSIKISKENILQIPIDGQLDAKELRVNFAPIQMFSGMLQVSEIQVNGGAILGKFFADFIKSKSKKNNTHSKLSWHDLFGIQINGFKLTDTYLNLVTILPNANHEQLTTEFVVKTWSVEKNRALGQEAFVSNGIVNAVQVALPPSLKHIQLHEANQLQWNAELTDKGLKLNSFVADLSGTRVQGQGMIDGDILDENSDPIIEAQADLHSDLGIFFLSGFNDDRWRGELDAKTKILAKFRDPIHTLKAQFKISGKNFFWKDISVSKFEGEGSIDPKLQRLMIKSLELQDKGSLKILTTEIPLNLEEPFQVQVELKEADIHWLGSAVPKTVAPLSGKVSGSIQGKFSIDHHKKWLFAAKNELKVDQFVLAGTRHVVLKPIVPITLIGDLEISPLGIDLKDFKVSLEKSQLNVSGGVHPKAEGFALNAKGTIDLKEINEISENKVLGEGEIEVSVHGSTDNVILDFLAKIKNSSYLGLHFGDLNGKISYEDGATILRLENVHAHYKNTYYSLKEGFLDLNGSDDIRLPFDIHSGRVEDLSEMLEKLVRPVSWYPKNLNGELHGTLSVEGKFTTPNLKVFGDVEGTDWTWLGEKARHIKMRMGYDRGTYFATDVILTKTLGAVKANIEYVSGTEYLKWNLIGEDLSFRDIDFLDRLNLPAKGKIEISSLGEGPLDHLKSKTEGRLFDTEIKGEKFEPSSLNLEMGESTLRASLNVFGKRLSSQLKYAMTPKQPSFFRLDLNNFDFSPALLILNPKLLDDIQLMGETTGHLQLDFLSTQSEFARGELVVKNYRFGNSDFLLDLIDPVNVPIQLGYFHFPPSRLKFRNSELVMGGEGKRGNIDFSLRGQTDLGIAQFFSSTISKAQGKADTDIRIFGPLKDLNVNGEMKFNGAKVGMKWLQSPFEEIDGHIRFRQGVIFLDSLESLLGEEVFSMSGKIQTYTNRYPEFDLKMHFEDNKIKMAPLERLQVKGNGSIVGTEPPYVIGGNIELSQALWTKSFNQSEGASTSRGDRFLPVDPEKQLASNLFKLDLNVLVPQGFMVKNEILDGEFKGKVKITGPLENPRLMGEGQLVQGKVFFKDRPFTLETVKIEFDDPYQLNPKFNASALNEVNQYKLRVLAYGRANSWKAEFTSTPFLPESEIFSLLASGYTNADSGRYKNRDRSYVSQGEAASLILHSMDFSKDVQKKTGFQFDVEEAVDASAANSIFRPQNLSDNVASPKLVLKRQFGRNIWFSVGSTVGVGSENQREVNAEYKLTPAMSALGVWNDIEEVNSTRNRTSFGLDLKFNKRFK